MLLLDTHALVWLASDREQLTENGQAAIRRSAGRLFMSAISSLEIALLVKRNRLELPLPPEQFLAGWLRHHGITEISVDMPGELVQARDDRAIFQASPWPSRRTLAAGNQFAESATNLIGDCPVTVPRQSHLTAYTHAAGLLQSWYRSLEVDA
jgi:PIN domain nuclease of toxin-antitoxin system